MKGASLAAAGGLCLAFGAVAEPSAHFQLIPMLEQPEDVARRVPVRPMSLQDCVRKRGASRGLAPRRSFRPGIGSAADLAALVDGVLCTQFEDAYIAGAAVAVVDQGQTAFSSGYFYSDYVGQALVDPVESMFRIGSISKLFTWTSLMQLVDQKRVILSADINSYLTSFKFPENFAQPITLKNLMTHTSGFEENFAGIGMARRWQDLPTLEETIEKHVPARVRPPATDFTRGESAAYSNWGGALGGYIVAKQSGLPFDDYLERNIFAPLGMTHSSFREPAPPDPRVSQGYRFEKGGAAVNCGFEYMHGLGPSGSGSVSAEDMARFMTAHLQHGRFENKKILEKETALLMQSRALSPHPHLTGSAYGFNERYVNGRRLLWHGGLTRCFYSELYLFPEEKLGLFVAYNTRPLASHAGQLAQAFMDHYFPPETGLPLPLPSVGDASRLGPYAGYYQATSRAHETWEKALTLITAIPVAVSERGALLAPESPGSKKYAEWILVPEIPGLLRRADGKESIALLKDAHGDAYIIGPWPFAPMAKLRWLEQPDVNDRLMVFCVLGFVLAILLALFAIFHHWKWQPYGIVVWLAAGLAILNAAILHGLWLTAQVPLIDVQIAVPRSLLRSMLLSLFCAMVTVGLALAIAHGWRRKDWTPRARIGFTLLAIPEFGFLAWLWFWNLIGFQLG